MIQLALWSRSNRLTRLVKHRLESLLSIPVTADDDHHRSHSSRSSLHRVNQNSSDPSSSILVDSASAVTVVVFINISVPNSVTQLAPPPPSVLIGEDVLKSVMMKSL